MNNQLTIAFLLHRRAYRETSFIAEFFTKDYGMVSVHAKGIRQGRGKVNILQPFLPLLIAFSGKGELKTLTQVEVHGVPAHLTGKAIFSALYMNELLMLLLPKWDAHCELFIRYEHALSQLVEAACHEKTLRIFEKQLLAELGYDLTPPHYENVIHEDHYYRFIPGDGFRVVALISQDNQHPHPHVFLGKNLINFFSNHLENPTCLQDAKRLVRLAISHVLGKKHLHSRQLFLDV